MKQYFENIRDKKRTIIWLLLLILLGLTFFFKLHPFVNEIVREINNELFSTLLPLIVFGFFYQLYIEEENREIAKKDIIEAIHLDKESLAMFSHQEKLNFISTGIRALIGDKYGNLLFNNVVKIYLKDDVLYRENYTYDVEIFESNKNFNFDGVPPLSRSDYYSLHETLVYSKRFKKNVKDIQFKIVFAFDENSLDHWMGDSAVFMREVLKIKEWKNGFAGLKERDLEKFINDSLSLDLSFFDENDVPYVADISYTVNYINKEKVKGLEIMLKDPQQINDFLTKDETSVYYRCRVSFKIPYSKAERRFHFVLPEPTLKPTFSIRFDRSFKDIDHISYLSNTSKSVKIVVDEYLSKYSITTSEIIYPRSGIIFFWQ